MSTGFNRGETKEKRFGVNRYIGMSQTVFIRVIRIITSTYPTFSLLSSLLFESDLRNITGLTKKSWVQSETNNFPSTFPPHNNGLVTKNFVSPRSSSGSLSRTTHTARDENRQYKTKTTFKETSLLFIKKTFSNF